MSLTLYDKIWNEHLVHQQDDGTALLFVDRHLIHEVTSPQAFEGLRNSNRKVRQPSFNFSSRQIIIFQLLTDQKVLHDADSRIQIETLR